MFSKQTYATLLFFVTLFKAASAATSIDTLPTTTPIFAPPQYAAQYKSIEENRFGGYVRLKIENDMLIARQKTDRYFTSGVAVDYFFLKNPSPKYWMTRIFPHLKGSDNYFGMTAATNMYTPANMTETILDGDRPFAGWAYVGLTNVSNDAATATRFSTQYTLGAIGPVTQQERLQCKWHEVIGRPIPRGWKNQIANDVALTLHFSGERRVLKAAEYVDVIGVLEANVGTVMNYMGFGGTVRVGWFDDYFSDIMQVNGGRNRWQAYVFMRPVVRIVADNALLQGGMFTFFRSPYTIPRDDVSRYYMNSEFGYALSYRRFNFTYSQCIRTPEFRGAKNMFWGAATFSIAL